jgi:two-component system, OmpR family, response regulator
MRILLVEDNRQLAESISLHLRRAGFVVDHVGAIDSGAAALSDFPYALALLDRRLPDGDGFSLISVIREKQPECCIFMLTALDAVDDRIEGLEAGADEYLTKPFNLDELVARIRASLRRSRAVSAPPIQIGALSFNPGQRAAFVRGQHIMLLRRELLALEALIARAGRLTSREALIAAIYGMDEEVQEHTLTTLISRLRARLASANAGVEIHSARGLGYMLKSDESKRENQ